MKGKEGFRKSDLISTLSIRHSLSLPPLSLSLTPQRHHHLFISHLELKFPRFSPLDLDDAQPWYFCQHPTDWIARPALTMNTGLGGCNPSFGRTRCATRHFSKWFYDGVFSFWKWEIFPESILEFPILSNLNYLLNFKYFWILNLIFSKFKLCIRWIHLGVHWAKVWNCDAHTMSNIQRDALIGEHLSNFVGIHFKAAWFADFLLIRQLSYIQLSALPLQGLEKLKILLQIL